MESLKTLDFGGNELKAKKNIMFVNNQRKGGSLEPVQHKNKIL